MSCTHGGRKGRQKMTSPSVSDDNVANKTNLFNHALLPAQTTHFSKVQQPPSPPTPTHRPHPRPLTSSRRSKHGGTPNT